ncbi:MAG: hypothetical protein BGP21_05530 [Thiobacillus sp. 65-29]|nr:MAG: hypothetical protein BGP21_05530 [Thiobacillus sp. 65-29]
MADPITPGAGVDFFNRMETAMFDTRLLRTLPKLAEPVLTAYVDVNPANPRNQGRPSGAGTWVKTQARTLAARLPGADTKLLREQAQRIDAYIDEHLARAKSLVFFAGAGTWKVLRLQVPVDDEMYWGKPSLGQLTWILDEHRPCGILVVDRNGARFFRYWMGELVEQKEERFEIDLTQWRRRELVTGRGVDRDSFEQRVGAQHARFFKETAARCRTWREREGFTSVFVAGPTEAAETVWEALPENCRAQGALVRGLPARVTGPELLRRIEPAIETFKRHRELEEVEALLATGEGARASLGIDTTLTRIQHGEARRLVAARGLRGEVRVCRQCGWVDRSAEDACPRCGGVRDSESLRTVLPELAHARNIPVEVVAGEAAERLHAVGGLAAWLA